MASSDKLITDIESVRKKTNIVNTHKKEYLSRISSAVSALDKIDTLKYPEARAQVSQTKKVQLFLDASMPMALAVIGIYMCIYILLELRVS